MSQVFGPWLRAQRRDRGWDVPQMARQIARAAGDGRDTLPSKECLLVYIRRWERGTVGVSERYKLLYCTAFGIGLAEFDAHGQPAPLPDPASPHPEPAPRAGDRYPAVITAHSGDPSPAGAQPGSLAGYRDGESRRREQPAEPAEQIMIAAAEESQDFGEWADTSNIGDATLEHYAAQVRRIASDHVHAAPLPLFIDTKRLRDRVFTKLQGHQRPDQTRDLYVIASQACGLLAWMSGDFGFQGAAQTHAYTAWVCAEHSGHDAARAWVRATQAKLAYWDARYLESARLAEDGLRYQCPGSGHTLLRVAIARSLARAGREDEARQALDRAADERERQSGQDEVGGTWSFGAASYHCLEGSTLLSLNNTDRAVTASGQAIALFEQAPASERRYGDEMIARIDHGRAHLQNNDLDGAAAALRPVLDVTPDQRQEPWFRNLQLVREALALPRYRDVLLARQLQEEIEAYCRESIVNDLRA